MIAELLLVTTLSAAPAPAAELTWYTEGFDRALEAAQAFDRPLVVYFWANTDTCSQFYQGPLSDRRVQGALGDFVCFSAQMSSTDGAELAERYGVRTVPTLYFMLPDGTPEDVSFGFLPADGLVEELMRVRRGELTVSGLRAGLRQEPKDFELHEKLMTKLGDLGDQDALAAHREVLVELDPKAATYVGAAAHFVTVKYETYAKKAETGALDLAPMYRFAKRVKNPEVELEVWAWLGVGETIEKNLEGARTAYRTWWKKAPRHEGKGELSGYLNPCLSLVQTYYDSRDLGLSRKEKRMVLEAAEAAVDLCERAQIPDSDGVWPGLWGTLGQAHFLNGDRDAAVEWLERALERRPDDAYFRDALAAIQEA